MTLHAGNCGAALVKFCLVRLHSHEPQRTHPGNRIRRCDQKYANVGEFSLIVVAMTPPSIVFICNQSEAPKHPIPLGSPFALGLDSPDHG